MKTNIFAPDLFKDRVVLITGAAGGVGGATVELLRSLGAKLAITDYKAEAINEKSAAFSALGIHADISSVADCQRVIETTLAHYGRLDALVNCAGVWVEGDSADATEEDWERCINVNLKGTFFMCSKAIPALKKSRGAIVNISSDAGVVGNVGAAIYCASKGGVTVLSRSLALELAPFGVRVNALCPSDIMSPMLQYQAEQYGNGDLQGYYQNLLNHYPQGEHARFIEPHEVASYIAYLLSPAAEPITGAAVMLDFGVTAGY
jgi:NAD(P)-dependent dehydrogenase (short-subunit alcohol dehydrogenase family)